MAGRMAVVEHASIEDMLSVQRTPDQYLHGTGAPTEHDLEAAHPGGAAGAASASAAANAAGGTRWFGGRRRESVFSPGGAQNRALAEPPKQKRRNGRRSTRMSIGGGLQAIQDLRDQMAGDDTVFDDPMQAKQKKKMMKMGWGKKGKDGQQVQVPKARGAHWHHDDV
jgi:hypothetical protein